MTEQQGWPILLSQHLNMQLRPILSADAVYLAGPFMPRPFARPAMPWIERPHEERPAQQGDQCCGDATDEQGGLAVHARLILQDLLNAHR